MLAVMLIGVADVAHSIVGHLYGVERAVLHGLLTNWKQ